MSDRASLEETSESTPVIWVFGDTSDGRPNEWTMELVSEARRLADQIGAARVAVLSDGRATLDLGERGADIVAVSSAVRDRVNAERREACLWALEDPDWSLVLVPRTREWIALMQGLLREISAVLLNECTHMQAHREREVTLSCAGLSAPFTLRLGVERAIVTIDEHVFELGPLQLPIVDVRRARPGY